MLHNLLAVVAPWQNLSFNTSGPWEKPHPKSHPSVDKAEILIALYEEINSSASFQCFGKRIVKGAQFSAELLSVPTLQLVGSLDTADFSSIPRIQALVWPSWQQSALEAHS